MKLRPSCPSPALVVALAALVLAAGGTALTRAEATPRPVWRANVTSVKKQFSLTNEGVLQAEVECPHGTQVFSGAYSISGLHVMVLTAGPARLAHSYFLYAYMPPVNINAAVGKETATITVAALCAPLNQPIVLG